MNLIRILFFQLPRLENFKGGEEENLSMAGFYLSHSLERSDIGHDIMPCFLRPDEERLDDSHLIENITDLRPDFICSTLYLWNVERSLHILSSLMMRLPGIRIICGGPEVARDHPFLFKNPTADAYVMGEGESLLSDIIKALQTGTRPGFRQVAWREGKGYKWGKKDKPISTLEESLPPPDHPGWIPDPNGMAYLETTRGCPMRCSYCRYPQMRRRPSFLRAEELLQRVRILKQRGASQIRFIDPTFNANPEFGLMLEGLADINRDRKISFFAEIQADRIEKKDIDRLSDAGFTEIEAGVQTLNPEVLRKIHRPMRIKALEQNIRLMLDKQIKVTIDLMYGLPGQDVDDVLTSIDWALGFKNGYVQCMQTLLLPGTELREMKGQWKIKSDRLPPYGIRSTLTISRRDVKVIEDFMRLRNEGECMTRRFVGYRLKDLFKERAAVSHISPEKDMRMPGKTSRRALIFNGRELYSQRHMILGAIKQVIITEPHILWQFVVRPDEEEPLDLLEDMIHEIRSHPLHWLDRFAHASLYKMIASRRVFVHLKKGHYYDPEWIEAAGRLLEKNFY